MRTGDKEFKQSIQFLQCLPFRKRINSRYLTYQCLVQIRKLYCSKSYMIYRLSYLDSPDRQMGGWNREEKGIQPIKRQVVSKSDLPVNERRVNTGAKTTWALLKHIGHHHHYELHSGRDLYY